MAARKSQSVRTWHGRGFRSPHRRDVERYMADVLSGRVNAGRLEIAAVQRHVDDLARIGRQGWRYEFQEREADRVIRFVEALEHSTGEFAGLPFLLSPWQKFLTWVLFGWRNHEGCRRFRKAFVSVARGNGKSPLAAALLLFLATADNPPEPRGELKIAATQRGAEDDSGAMIVFNEAARMIGRSAALAERCRRFRRSIVYTPNGSTIQPLGKEAKTKDGFVLHGFVADELHEWHDEHRGTWEKLETAMHKRRQPLGLIITTAGNDRSHIWREEHAAAAKVVQGVYTDDQLFVLIFSLNVEEGDLPAADPFDPANIRQANPNLDVSCRRDALEQFQTAARHNPAKRNAWLRYHANVMVRSRLKVIDLATWAAGDQPLPDLVNSACHGGLDLGWRDDLLSFYTCHPLREHRFALRGCSWIPEETPHRDLTAEPFASWIRAGMLRVTPGNTTDPDALFGEIKRVQRCFNLRTVALDPNNARTVEVHLVNNLGIDVYAFGQNAKKYNEPLRSFLDALRDGRILHGGDPVLTWAASNLVVRTAADGLWMPDKAHSDEKIDPLVAALMAYSECLYAVRKPAGYADRGLRRIQRGT